MKYPIVLSRTALPLAMAAVLALGGCKKDEAPSQTTAAGGEILPRSVSDDMLPYDTVRSQAPLANPDSGKNSSTASKPAAEPQQSAGEGAAAPEPAESADTDAPAGEATPGAE